jgi:enoyl-CoA hydratase/carnithine racemase
MRSGDDAAPGYGDLLYVVDGGVATITLNRPGKLNALREQTFEELADALRRADRDPAIGVVVLAGSTDSRAFCAGGDLQMATAMRSAEEIRDHYFNRMVTLSRAVLDAGKPVLCAIHGACVGGGAELSLFCDQVIVAEEGFLSFNGTEIGGASWWGAPQLMPLMVGFRRAEEILYSARRVGGTEAAEIGLATRAVPADRLDAAVGEACGLLLDRSAEGLRQTKAGMRATKEIVLATMSAAAESSVGGHPGVVAAFEAFLRGKSIDWRAQRAASG